MQIMRAESSKKNIKKITGIFAAGFVNGMLGTGGGTVLFLTHSGAGERQKYVQSLIVMLVGVYSAAGAALKGCGDMLPLESIAQLLLGGAAGTVLGCTVLGKADGRFIRLVFSILLIISGVRMLL